MQEKNKNIFYVLIYWAQKLVEKIMRIYAILIMDHYKRRFLLFFFATNKAQKKTAAAALDDQKKTAAATTTPAAGNKHAQRKGSFIVSPFSMVEK